MKKIYKIIVLVLLTLLAIFFILALTQSKDLSIERSLIIKAPQQTVFNQIKYFNNWTNWSPWYAKEPTMKMLYLGQDGQVGSSYRWKGDEMGEGEMSNVGINNNQLNYNLKFIKPWEGLAEGSLVAEDMGNGTTMVKWSMINHGTFPFNALNFFMERIIGNDFEEGLSLLKKYTESNPFISMSANDIEEKDFAPATYATIRKKVTFNEMQDFSSKAFEQLSMLTKERMIGTATTFYYDWDEKNQITDMAPAFAIKGSEPIKEATMVSLAASKTCQIVCKGAYSNIGKAHELLGKYISEKGKKLNVVLEEYVSGPANEADSNKWITNIIYLVE